MTGAASHPSRPRRRLIQTVVHACDALALLRDSRDPVKLASLAAALKLAPSTAFRIVDTLCAKGFVERDGRRGYRPAPPPKQRSFRIGYAAQSSEFAFSRAVADSIVQAARAANLELLVADNRYSKSAALRNADHFVRSKVDLVIEFQTVSEIAPVIASKYHAAGIPMIAVEIPHPGATFYGADNYRAGQIGGHYLGSWAKKHWNGQVDEVLLLELELAGPLPQSRLTGLLDGILAVLPKLPRASVLHLNGNGQFEASLAAVRKHLRSSSAGRVLVGAVNDPSVLGALCAFEEAGRPEHCAAMGQNASEEAREEMRRPGTRLIGSVAYFPERYGPEIIAIALEILNRRAVPPAVFAKHRLVTPQNVNQIYPTDLIGRISRL